MNTAHLRKQAKDKNLVFVKVIIDKRQVTTLPDNERNCFEFTYCMRIEKAKELTKFMIEETS